MDIKLYKWKTTPQINKSLQEIEVLKRVFEKIILPTEAVKRLLRKSLLNNAVFSARIEDIPSTVEHPRKEGKNLLQAYQDIYAHINTKPLTVEEIKALHLKTMTGLSGMAGQYRQEPWGIFNQAGMEIHHAPLHIHIPGQVVDLVTLVNKLEAHPSTVAAVAQFIFEKIHPFADGNGRTGRLISAYLLHRSGYWFGGLISLENYINEHRGGYYQTLEPSHDCTAFIEFFLEAIIFQANKTLDELESVPDESPESFLMPRRRELLEIIRNHPECSFNFLSRRFVYVKPLSIHRDLVYLQKNNLVKKLGSTRGAVYIAKG